MKTITLDYVMAPMRLCWRSRQGGQWGQSELRLMTESYAAKLVAYMNQEFPEFEHWVES